MGLCEKYFANNMRLLKQFVWSPAYLKNVMCCQKGTEVNKSDAVRAAK